MSVILHRVWRRVATAAAALLMAISGPSAFPAMAQTAEQQARIGRLERAVLAPCCYAEPVAIHQSEIALKMRLEIAKWVTSGKSDQEILGAYVQEYGAKVLVDPRTIPAWWTPWIPWLTVVFGVAVVFLILKRWRSNRLPPAPPSGFEDRPLPDIDIEDEEGA